MSTDNRGTKILTRTFFNQLKESGYNQNQIIGVASELLELVTTEIRDVKSAESEAPSAHPDAPRAQA
jgi:hypothetical protein